MRNGFWRHAMFVVMFGVAAGCSSDSTGPSNTQTIHMQSAAFSPANVTIQSGSSVTWVNDTATPHNITPNNPAQAGVWAAQNIPAQVGASFTNRFTTAGTFDYHCTIHAGMTGRIIVQ